MAKEEKSKATKAMKLLYLKNLIQAKVNALIEKLGRQVTEELDVFKHQLRCLDFTLKDKGCSEKWATVDPNIEGLWKEHRAEFPTEKDEVSRLRKDAEKFEGKYPTLNLYEA